MRILVLGGTKFLGRHVVEAALGGGHDVTLFNRGQTRPELFPEVEKLRGDRDGDLGALAGRRFDAVVDTSGYVPRVVQTTLEALGEVGHYTFVSSISAYADLSRPPREDAFVPRPGLIVGPWDPTGRFTYWPLRIAAGGAVLETCLSVAGSDAEPVWVDPAFLLEQGVEEWMELPLWIQDPAFAGMAAVPVDRALAAGLRTRPLAETVADTLVWACSGDAPADPPAGLDREKERRVLAAWESR